MIVGVLDGAVAVAKDQLCPRAAGLRTYEKVEWTRAVDDHWVAVQAYKGSLRATKPVGQPHCCAKEGVAELPEATLGRLVRVIGGGAFSQRSPFAYWFEDVRALGFRCPPRALAYDAFLAKSFDLPPPPRLPVPEGRRST